MGAAFAQELATLEGLLTDPLLVAALVGGLVGLVTATVTRLLPSAAGVGLGVVAAAAVLGQVGWPAAAGLAIMSLSGLVEDRFGLLARSVVGGAGAVVAVLGLYRTMPTVVMLVVAVMAALALPPPPERADRAESLLLLLTLAGVWATVPDTELAIVALGGGVVALALPDVRAGAPHLPTVLLVLGAAGAAGRLTSLWGVAVAIGLLWWPGRSGPSRWLTLPLHLALVVVGSRVVGMIGA